MKLYHTTTKDRLESILANGLLPNSHPNWFTSPAPYVMFSEQPWQDLNGLDSVVLEVEVDGCVSEYLGDPEGVRWPHPVPPENIKMFHINFGMRTTNPLNLLNKLEGLELDEQRFGKSACAWEGKSG